jgi:hypothetical protein
MDHLGKYKDNRSKMHRSLDKDMGACADGHQFGKDAKISKHLSELVDYINSERQH